MAKLPCPDKFGHSGFAGVDWLGVLNRDKAFFLWAKLHLDVCSCSSLFNPTSSHTRATSDLDWLVWDSWIETRRIRHSTYLGFPDRFLFLPRRDDPQNLFFPITLGLIGT